MIELAALTALFVVILWAARHVVKYLLIVAIALVLANVAPLEAWQPWRDAVFLWIGDYVGPFAAGAGATTIIMALLWRVLKMWLIQKLYHEEEENARRKRDNRLAQL